MITRLSWRTRTGIGLVALAITAVLVITQVQGGSSQHADRTYGLLLTGNRDRLAICVQGVNGAPVDAQRSSSAIGGILQALKGRSDWSVTGLDVDPPAVASGCNSEPFLLQPGVSFSNGVPDGGFAGVATPSPFRVMVFVLEPEELDKVLGGSPVRHTVQELTCEEHMCSEVTTGLYVTAQELEDVPFMTKQLTYAIGLERPADTSGGPQPAPKKPQLP